MKSRELPYARVMFWLLIAALAASRLAVALADYRSLIANDIYQDDAFYYLKIADNLAAGRGFTFDGQTMTSGFQPLFQLLLVPIAWLTHPSLTAPIHASALLLAVCAVATGFLVYHLGRMVGGVAAGLAALGFWTLSPVFVIFGINGQDTGFAILFAVAIVVSWLRLRGSTDPKLKTLGTTGFVWGLGVLARLDLAILLLAVACDWGWSSFVRGQIALRARSAAIVVVAAGIVWGSWAVTSRYLIGDWLPLSGPASRQIALNFGWQSLPRVWSHPDGGHAASPSTRFFATDAVPLDYRLDVATQAVAVLLYDQPVLAALRFDQPFSPWPQLGEYPIHRGLRANPRIGWALLLIGWTLGVLVVRRVARVLGPRADALASFARIFGIYLCLLVPMYVWYCPVHWYFSRYFTVAGLFAAVLGTGVISLVAGAQRERRTWLHTTLLAGLVVLVALQFPQWRFFQGLQWHNAASGGFLASWESVQPTIPTTARVGAFQSGIIGWFSRRDVVNLDGKVNRDAYDAIREHRLARYIHEQRLDYVLDWDWVIYALCARYAKPEEMGRWELMPPKDRGAGMSLYAIHAQSP